MFLKQKKVVAFFMILTLGSLIFAADFHGSADLKPGKGHKFSVRPKGGVVISGEVVIPDGFDWTSEHLEGHKDADWFTTIPPNYPKLHRGYFRGKWKKKQGNNVKQGNGNQKQKIYDWTFETFYNTGEFTLGNVIAVRRLYGDKDKGEVSTILIKGTKDNIYTLKIKKLSGEGDASFDKEGKKKQVSYTGTGDWESLKLYGQLESTEEENMEIWGEDSGGSQVGPSSKFIVFSNVKIKWDSEETQHKDTAAVCTKCDGQPQVPPLHRHDADVDDNYEPCDHEDYHERCFHCVQYCARCCMKQIRGGFQDDYRIIRNKVKTSVEENHGIPIDNFSIQTYDFIFPAKRSYKQLYEKIINEDTVDRKLTFQFAGHCYISRALQHNDETGKITKQQVYLWDPQSAGTEWQDKEADARYTYLKLGKNKI